MVHFIIIIIMMQNVVIFGIELELIQMIQNLVIFHVVDVKNILKFEYMMMKMIVIQIKVIMM